MAYESRGDHGDKGFGGGGGGGGGYDSGMPPRARGRRKYLFGSFIPPFEALLPPSF